MTEITQEGLEVLRTIRITIEERDREWQEALGCHGCLPDDPEDSVEEWFRNVVQDRKGTKLLEREACAKVAEQSRYPSPLIAAAIRARGEK